MDITAGYLNQSEDDGRNPTEFNPELSRRARGFAAWAVIRALGKSGVRDLVASHCRLARWVADEIATIPGLEVAGVVELNQVIVSVSDDTADPGLATRLLAEELNNTHAVFVRTAIWKDRIVLRLSFIANGTDERHAKDLARSIRAVWTEVRKKLEA
jgi:glutamate/tyrosine decarboxylase-like PLP-dependent enzyme